MHTDLIKDSADQSKQTLTHHKAQFESVKQEAMAADEKPYLSVKDLVVGYDDITIVDGLSLILKQGEIGCFGI